MRTIVVDTSNEIAGTSDIAHEGIGRARRMQVTKGTYQHETLIEAVQNHNPQVIIIDEIGTKEEVKAARTIAQRGVAIVATAHGVSLDSLMKNPDLLPLLGGIGPVTLGDNAAK
jgi:stage III sporulation protein SpoIIIAA